MADEADGVIRLGPEAEGFTAAASVLADVRRIAGRLPAMVDLRFDQTSAERTDARHRP